MVPIPRRVDPEYIWGEALAVLDDARLSARIINLETAVTERGDPWPGKGIHYRMHLDNLDCITAAGIDCCVLANNHILDWSVPGLEQTLDCAILTVDSLAVDVLIELEAPLREHPLPGAVMQRNGVHQHSVDVEYQSLDWHGRRTLDGATVLHSMCGTMPADSAGGSTMATQSTTRLPALDAWRGLIMAQHHNHPSPDGAEALARRRCAARNATLSGLRSILAMRGGSW